MTAAYQDGQGEDLIAEAAEYVDALQGGENANWIRLVECVDNLATALKSRNGEVSALREVIEKAKAVHVRSAYWVGEDQDVTVDENGEETEPAGYVCLTCSDDHIESDLENWNFDESDGDAVFWPCPTIEALTVPAVASPETPEEKK